tara:strand:+ start:1692 stop:3071 length:1380 start_codon:yes stop_codon:yes gene_type:complete
MSTYNSGQVKFGTPGAVIDSTIPSRRLFDFSDRVADLAPEESPFFVYLSKVGKVPTSDSQFRFLEDRTKIAITDRSFFIDGAATLAAPGSITSVTVETAAGSTGTAGNVSWLLKGMVVQFQQGSNVDGGEDTEAIINATARIESVTHNAADTTISVKTIQASAGDSSTTTLDDAGRATVIGTSFGEGTGAPDVWSQELDNGFGFTQIFKTACEMSNTARATVYRGYADEWQRIWNLKLREHKVDIERAMLFGMQASVGGVQYTDGIAGNIIKNAGTAVAGATQLSYVEGNPYLKSFTAAELNYDALLGDFEVIFDPARGGGSSKLALASLPVMSHFNKLGDGKFVDSSLGHSANPYKYDIDSSTGAFGHKVMKVDTIHGDMTLVKEPLFRANSSGYLCLVDLDHVSYRPLVGNGMNRDTSITTNVQQADEDLRKDMILTEAGLEVTLPETHALLHLEGV